MDQNQRQNKQSEPIPQVRNNGRITRGFSDLPKQQPKPESSSESEEEELSQSTPKVKKIHHMTLKKLQRLEKLAEMERLGLIQPAPKVEKLPPRKRGRPKGTTKKVPPPESEIESFKEPANQSLLKVEKKDFLLRKRENSKRMVDEPSEELLDERNQLKSVEIEIIVPEKIVESQAKQQKQQKPQQDVVVPPVVPPAPKKRGRKKKVQPELLQPQPLPVQNAAPKVFTVPKAQTYDNYNKFYAKLLAETKESEEKELPLIFDKFSDPEGYKAMLSLVTKSRP